MAIQDALSLIGSMLQMQQAGQSVKTAEQNRKRSNLSDLLEIGNTFGINPDMYRSIQQAAKSVGLNIPDIQANSPVQQPQQGGGDILQMLTNMVQGGNSNSPLGLPAIAPTAAAPRASTGLSPEEQQIIGPARIWDDFAGEVATEMGINPDNLVGGEPLKKYRQESSMRYRQYLKDRESQVKGLMMETLREKRQLTVEDKKEKAREALEEKKEKARAKTQLEAERIGDERQTAALAASDKKHRESLAAMERRLGRSLTAAEKRARLHEDRADRRAANSQSGIQGRFERRRSDKLEGKEKTEKKKLVTIYGPGGRTKMVPVSAEGDYEPPQGWTLEKPSREEKQLQMLLGGQQQGGGGGGFDINGKVVKLKRVNGKLVPAQ